MVSSSPPPARPAAPGPTSSPLGTGPATPWAVMGMEAALAYALLAHSLASPEGRAPLGPAAALVMLPLGYLAARRGLVRGVPVDRWSVGVGVGLALRLLVTLPLLLAGPPPGAAPTSPLLWLLNWLLGAVLPTAVAYGLWWRGTNLADAELTAEGVRNEFVLVGCGLLGALAVFRDLAAIGPLTSIVAVVAFLCSGLVAVALARQEEAGLTPTAGSSALVAWAVLLVLLASVALVALLSPELAAAVLAVVGSVVGAVLWLLMLPLFLLLSWLQIRLPLPQDTPLPDTAGPPGDLAERAQIPEWLLQALAAVLSVVAVIAIVLTAVVLMLLLLMWLQRTSFRVGARAPVALEGEGTPWQDARALLAGLGGWLGRLAGSARAARADTDWRHVRDARAAYRALLRWARGRNLPRTPAETPAEFARRLADRLPAGDPHYGLLTAAYERARYGERAVSAPEVARLRESLGALYLLPVEPRGAQPTTRPQEG